jgi:hypothetical protein
MIGVMGGPVLVKVPEPGGTHLAGQGLRRVDPARYSSLDHPGDGYAFDIFTQVARAIRAGGEPLGGAQPQRLIAAGESQSAGALVTYYNGVAPLTHAFDGYLVHSRGAVPCRWRNLGNRRVHGLARPRARDFRTDQRRRSSTRRPERHWAAQRLAAASPCSDSFRFGRWPVPHAERVASASTVAEFDCGLPVNNAADALIVEGAFWRSTNGCALDAAPQCSPFRDHERCKAEVKRDVAGFMLGGIRTPRRCPRRCALRRRRSGRGDDRDPERLDEATHRRAACAAIPLPREVCRDVRGRRRPSHQVGHVAAGDRKALLDDAQPTASPGDCACVSGEKFGTASTDQNRLRVPDTWLGPLVRSSSSSWHPGSADARSARSVGHVEVVAIEASDWPRRTSRSRRRRRRQSRSGNGT